MLEKDILKVLVTQEEIAEAVARLGKTLTEDYKDKEVVVVGILRGAAIFMAEPSSHRVKSRLSKT